MEEPSHLGEALLGGAQGLGRVRIGGAAGVLCFEGDGGADLGAEGVVAVEDLRGEGRVLILVINYEISSCQWV